MENRNVVVRIVVWLFEPHAIKIPLILWIIALTGVILLLNRPAPPPAEREVIERTVIVTATPQPTWFIPTPVPGVTPTPVGSGGTLAFTMRHNGNSDQYIKRILWECRCILIRCES